MPVFRYFLCRDLNGKPWAYNAVSVVASRAVGQLFDVDWTASAPAKYFSASEFFYGSNSSIRMGKQHAFCRRFDLLKASSRSCVLHGLLRDRVWSTHDPEAGPQEDIHEGGLVNKRSELEALEFERIISMHNCAVRLTAGCEYCYYAHKQDCEYHYFTHELGCINSTAV